MVSVKFENVWTLMSKYSFVVDSDSITEDLTCAICKKLMMDSYQSNCGCQYCHKCIQGYLGGESKYCPGGKEECKEEHLSFGVNLYGSGALNKKISKLSVYCPIESCHFKGELLKMEDHLRVCSKQTAECPYVHIGCENEEGPKDEILSHLNEDIFNHNNLLIEYIQNLRNEVNILKEKLWKQESMQQEINYLKENLEIAKLEIFSLNEESIINKYKMEELKEEVDNLKEESVIKDIQIREIKKEVSELKENFVRRKLENNSLNEELSFTKNQIEELKKEIGILKEVKVEEKTLKEELFFKEKRIEIQNNVKTLLTEGNIENLILNVERQENIKFLNELRKKLKVDFVWRVNDISKKVVQKIYSEPFISNNYRLCLRLSIDIYGCIWVGVCLMKGEKDDKVEWPLKRAVTLSLLDEDSLSSVETLTLSYDTFLYNKEAFQRPKKERNDYSIYGRLSFGYSSLRSRPSILARDSLLISIVLSPKK